MSKSMEAEALSFLKGLRTLWKKHPRVYSLVIWPQEKEEGTELNLELDAYDDYDWGDDDTDLDPMNHLHTPLSVEIAPGKCRNIYPHTIDYLIQEMEKGNYDIKNPNESEKQQQQQQK